MSRFPALIDAEGNREYEIVYTGTVAKQMKYTLYGPPGSAMRIRVHYTNPSVYSLYNSRNKYIPQNDFDKKTKQLKVVEGTHCGENRYIPVKNYLEFYITEGCTLFIKPRNVV